MLREVKARKNKSLTPTILESMTVAVTLSGRLRQAGIRKCEPNCGTKTGNLSQNRKNQTKAGLDEKRNERNKKLQNLCNDFYSPYLKDCYQYKTSREKAPSKIYATFSKTLRRKIRGSAKKTIFASLDFIKDCKKYKKKVINPEKHSKLKGERKGKSESAFNNHKHNLYIKKGPQKLQDDKTYSQTSFCDSIKKKEDLILDVWDDKELENCSVKRNPSFFDQNTKKVNTKEKPINDEKKFNEFPSGDVARIDKKFLQSLLSITNTKDKKYANDDESGNNEEVTREKHNQRKGKKKSNEFYSENQTRNKKSEDRRGAVEEKQKDSETIQTPSYKKSVFAKTLRKSTKSEAQLFVQKNKFYIQRNSEMKSEKNMAHAKTEVNDTRKNRKTRNKSLKNKNEEFSDSEINEIAKVLDIKELWRRDIREKSENSLSSNSSCTVPKSDADPEQKNLELESYKVLKKFVEEEVKKMSNESEKKNNLKEAENVEYNFKTNEFKSVNLKESEKMEKICEKLKVSKTENLNDEVDIIKNEMHSLKKKLAEADYPQCYSIYEGEKINSTLLSAVAEDKLKNQKNNKKPLKEKGKSCEKTPSQLINNWSILNRLEQAFLALGTPNFKDKVKNIKNSKLLKGKELISNEKIKVDTSRKGQNHLEKIYKEPQTSKEVEGKKGDKNVSNTLYSTVKTPKQRFRNKPSKTEDGVQRNLTKDKHQKNTIKKESKKDGSQNKTLVKSTEFKQTVAVQDRKKTSKQKIRENITKKSTVKSTAKPKVIVREPGRSKRQQDKKPLSVSDARAKKTETCPKILPKVIKQNKDSGEAPLEKTQTLDIIQKEDLSTEQPIKSKNCEKIDDNSEMENVSICFPQIKNQELKKSDSFQKNLKNTQQSGGENMKNEAKIKTKSLIPKRIAEVPIKLNPEFCEKNKSTEVEEDLKLTQENSANVPESKTDQEKPCKDEKEAQEFPTQSQEKNEKVIKERSILSMNGKQQNPQDPIMKLMQIEGKVDSDIHSSPQISNTESSETEKSQSDLRDFLKSLTKPSQQTNSSTISSLNISNLKLTDSNSTENQKKTDISSHESSTVELSKKLTPMSDFSNNNSIFTQVSEAETDETELNLPRCKTKMLWEQDIRHYQALVKEIMSQYKRIDGFLTHSYYLQNFSSDSADLLSIKNSTDKDSMSNKSLKMNLREYRKKIISEYQALPIFEYKRLLQEKKEQNLLTKEARKRNLMVVKDITSEMDLDVKDFPPKIHKVLDSQFYVSAENLIKRNHLKVKFKEKKSSLQEIVLDKNEKMTNQERLRTISTIKTFPPLPTSSVCVESFLKSKTMENFQDSTETATSTSVEETESEYL